MTELMIRDHGEDAGHLQGRAFRGGAPVVRELAAWRRVACPVARAGRGRVAAALAAFGVASWLGAVSVAADPAKGQLVPLSCDNGKIYVGLVNGDAEFTAIHDVGSTATLVPVQLGPFTGTVTDREGRVVSSFTSPGSSKGRSATGLADPITCSFSFQDVSDGSDPGFPEGYTFTGSGTIVVRITPSS